MSDDTNPHPRGITEQQLRIAEPSAEDAERAAKKFRAVWEPEEPASSHESDAVLAHPIVPLTSSSTEPARPPPERPQSLQRTVIGLAMPNQEGLRAQLLGGESTKAAPEAPAFPSSPPAMPAAPPRAHGLHQTMIGLPQQPGPSPMSSVPPPFPTQGGFVPPRAAPPPPLRPSKPAVMSERPHFSSVSDSDPPLRPRTNKALVVLIVASIALLVFVASRLLSSSDGDEKNPPAGRTDSIPVAP